MLSQHAGGVVVETHAADIHELTAHGVVSWRTWICRNGLFGRHPDDERERSHLPGVCAHGLRRGAGSAQRVSKP
jgi:hypothetical protein